MNKSREGATGTGTIDASTEQLARISIRKGEIELSSLRVGYALKLLFLLFWVLVILALVAMALRAHGSRGIVIDTFEVAPAFASDGLTGDVLANQIRGRLTAMRAETPSSRAIDALKSDWIDDYKIEIPQTKITFRELNNAFRRHLGNETRVSGEIVRLPSNEAALTVRVSVARVGVAIERTFTRNPLDPPIERGADPIGRLVERGAEWIYEQTDPYLFATYLSRVRKADSSQAYANLAATALDEERALALNGLANNVIDFNGRCAEALRILETARSLSPHPPLVYGNLRSAHYCLGHEQAAADSSARELALLEGSPHQLPLRRVVEIHLQDQDNLAGHYGDFSRRLELYGLMEAAGFGNQSLVRASALADLHSAGASMIELRRWYATQQWRAISPWERAAYWNIRFSQAWALENWPEAARFIALHNDINRGRGPYYVAHIATQTLPLEAIARARSGGLARAQQIIAQLPPNCYLCSRSRAIVAEASGQGNLAHRWFRHAIRLGPRLPFAYTEYGQALLRHRHGAADALAQFDRAVAYGPRFADAHKGQGDALSALSRYGDATVAYAMAAGLAPRWGALHMAWGHALSQLGRGAEARDKFCAAASMDLSQMDRDQLNQLITARNFRTC